VLDDLQDGVFGGGHPCLASDGEGDAGRCVSEVHACNDRDATQFFLRLDDLHEQFLRHVAFLFKASDDHPLEALRKRLMEERLEITIERLGVRFAVVFDEQDDISFRTRHVLRSMQEVQRTEVAADDRAFRLSLLEHSPPFVQTDIGIILIVRPSAIDVVLRRLHLVGRGGEIASHESVLRILESLLLPEAEEVGAGIGRKPRFRVDRVAQRRDVREAAETLRVLLDEIVVDVPQELVAVVATDDGQHELHLGISERGVQIFETVFDGRGLEAIHFVDVFSVGHGEAEIFQALLCKLLQLIVHPRQKTAGRCDHEHGVAFFEGSGNHTSSIVGIRW